MSTIEEIRAGIQEKSVERSEAVKKIWAEIERKRKEKKTYKKAIKKTRIRIV